MKPASVVEYLCNLAEYIDTHPNPSKFHVASHLSGLSDLLEGSSTPRTAGFLDSLKSILKSPTLDETKLKEIEQYWKRKEELEKELADKDLVVRSISTRGKLYNHETEDTYYILIARALKNINKDRPWSLGRAKEMGEKLLDILPGGDASKIRKSIIRFRSSLDVLDLDLDEDFKKLKKPILEDVVSGVRNLGPSISSELQEVKESIKEEVQQDIQHPQPVESEDIYEQVDITQLSQEDNAPVPDSNRPSSSSVPKDRPKSSLAPADSYPLRTKIMGELYPLIQGIIDRKVTNVSAPGIFRNMIDGLPDVLPFEYLAHLKDIQEDFDAGIRALHNNGNINEYKKNVLDSSVKDQLPLEIFKRYVKGLEVTNPMPDVALLGNSRFLEITDILRKSGINDSWALFKKYFKEHHGDPSLIIEQDGPNSFMITRMKNDINIPKKWVKASNQDELDQITHDQDSKDKYRRGEININELDELLISYVAGKNLQDAVKDPNVISVSQNHVITRTLDSAKDICRKLLTGGVLTPASPGRSTPPVATPAVTAKKPPQQPGAQNPPRGSTPSTPKPASPPIVTSPPSISPNSTKSPVAIPNQKTKKPGEFEKEEKWVIDNVINATLNNDSSDWRNVFKNLIKDRLSNLITSDTRKYKEDMPEIIKTFKSAFNEIHNSLTPDRFGQVAISLDYDPSTVTIGRTILIENDLAGVLRQIFSSLKNEDSYEGIVSEIYNVLNMKL